MLQDINEVIDASKALVGFIQRNGTVRTGNHEYNHYKDLIAQFVGKYRLKDSGNPYYFVLDRYYFYEHQSYTVNLAEARMIYRTLVAWKHELVPDCFEKVFISHREKDKPQVDAFINLLHAIGIARPRQSQDQKTIFCSSHPAYYIENGKKNLDEIKQAIQSDQHTFFILWYTDNYFDSQACLNEVGAIWALDKRYQEILSPTFDHSRIGGLLDKQPTWFVSTDKYRLNTFKEQLEKMFDLDPLQQNAWEKARDEFIDQIYSIIDKRYR